MTCQTEVPDLVTLTKELKPGTIYRVKGYNTSWRYAMVLKQVNNKQEIIVLSPQKNIVKLPITAIPWIVKEMNLKFEIVKCA